MFTLNSTYEKVQRELEDALKQNVLLTTRLDAKKRSIQEFASANRQLEQAHANLSREVKQSQNDLETTKKDAQTFAVSAFEAVLEAAKEVVVNEKPMNRALPMAYADKIKTLLSLIKEHNKIKILKMKALKIRSDDQNKALKDQQQEIATLKAKIAHFETCTKINGEIIEKLESEKAKLTNDLKETKNQLTAFGQVVQTLNHMQYREDVRAGAKRKRLKDITPLD